MRRNDDSMPTFDMTPMIDVVFQLIIFFMLVTDMNRREYEPVELPVADRAFDENDVHPDELVITLHGSGPVEMRVNGVARSHDWLEAFLATQRTLPRVWEVPGGFRVNYPLLVRAGREVPWIEVQRVLMMAGRFGGVYRVALAARSNP